MVNKQHLLKINHNKSEIIIICAPFMVIKNESLLWGLNITVMNLDDFFFPRVTAEISQIEELQFKEIYEKWL